MLGSHHVCTFLLPSKDGSNPSQEPPSSVFSSVPPSLEATVVKILGELREPLMDTPTPPQRFVAETILVELIN